MHQQTHATRIFSRLLRFRRDTVIVAVLAVVAGVGSMWEARRLEAVFLEEYTGDAWFGSNTHRTYGSMVSRWNGPDPTGQHPLFPLAVYPWVFMLRRGFGMDTVAAVRTVSSAVAVLWISVLFVLLRLVGCRRLDATLFTVLAAISASTLFWFVVPGAGPFGSLSILLALCLSVAGPRGILSSLWAAGISLFTFSFALTNGMAGILTTAVTYPWKRFLRIMAVALCLLLALGGVQKRFFPNAGFLGFASPRPSSAQQTESGDPLKVIRSFVFHSVVMPAAGVIHQSEKPDCPQLTTQTSAAGSGSTWGAVAVVPWALLLAMGLTGYFSTRRHFGFRLVLGLFLLGQLALHLLRESETFLDSPLFGPLLVLLAAFGTLTRGRPIALALTGLLILTGGIHNGMQIRRAERFFQSHGAPRRLVLEQMRTRPTDPWPRGTGHVLLAVPGSREEAKAYHEPGGGFSPTVGSFGISLWVTDDRGNIMATSDDIPLNQIGQRFVWNESRAMPGILTETPHYQMLWSADGDRQWMLRLNTLKNPNARTALVLRSVGPAGGPIRSLEWDGGALSINGRWVVTIHPRPGTVQLGEENQTGWTTERTDSAGWCGDSGWGYARFELAASGTWDVVIRDTLSVQALPGVGIVPTRSDVKLRLPDGRFTSCFNAQIAHLTMGLVDRQTRPGDPMNYPLAWQRDGTHVVAALARAGLLETAKLLSRDLAEKDFFGGFGSEADAPGLAIWALEETASRIDRREYDMELWPHVQRKAECIMEMLAADRPIRRPFAGPSVPRLEGNPNLTLVAEPARNGLILGRMDNHFPLLFVNAVSYRGLLDAASLAVRVNRMDCAERWRKKAQDLGQAWSDAFRPPESQNPRTCINGFSPAGIAVLCRDRYAKELQDRWNRNRDPRGGFRTDPLWTYFDIAEAIQWVFLDRPDRVWPTLIWFWDHQSSPGLYTWWEGHGEENTFNRWQGVRGWVKPTCVTPHYWTAAEILMLQLDMLACMRPDAGNPVLVVGAGIPNTWLQDKMAVMGLPIPFGRVDWRWDGHQMDVTIHGRRMHVQLGSTFPSDTPIRIDVQPAR